MSKNYIDLEIKKTVLVDKEVISKGNLESIQAIFPLKEADFLRLKSRDSRFKTFSGYILGAVIGYVFNILKNIYNYIVNNDLKAVQTSEWVIIVSGVVASIVCYLIGEFLPNERSTVMKTIEKYFKDNCDK
ncbi:hypothetical protein NCZ17_06495 [Acinetobacter modestus]|uniref:hypothetical protein n=1 Tax=Acinetobacter modestus TaxID=1776740 RepID=UPI00202DFB77|nr:hypothetical protein [Acinetobacter modestus]MCM1959019.1 hypothetical protein [Acinetobacter modestus]